VNNLWWMGKKHFLSLLCTRQRYLRACVEYKYHQAWVHLVEVETGNVLYSVTITNTAPTEANQANQQRVVEDFVTGAAMSLV
jgi:hypothetical protein